MLIQKEDIKKLIPQRSPILMVDTVESYVAESSITTSKFLSEDAPAFKGHFPGFPLLPGVLLTEAAAQTGAILMQLDEYGWMPGYPVFAEASDEIGVLGAVKVRFRKPVFPNTRFFINANIEWKRHGAISLKVKAVNEEGELLMGGTLMLSTTQKSQLAKVVQHANDTV